MVRANVSDGDAESSGEQYEESRSEHEAEQESVDSETREEVLSRDGYRCQTCGRRGPSAGGLATLQIHHIERDPVGMDEHALENLTTLCRSCHNWLHQQSTSDDSPVELTDEDMNVLLPQDIEILRFLADEGPARTGDIKSGLTADLTVNAVRQRLWVLMALDNLVAERDKQVVDKSVETGEWGLTNQIEASERGYIPDDPQLLLQRMEDEQVREALDRGCSREAISEVLGISERTTWNKEKRAAAFGFPLDAVYRGRSRGGEVSAEDEGDDGVLDRADSRSDEEDGGDVEVWKSPDAADGGPDVREILAEDIIKHKGVVEESDGRELDERVEEAIAALEAFQSDLSVG